MSTPLEGYYWAVFDTFPRSNPELFLRYTACLCGPRYAETPETFGDWKKVRECKNAGSARRLANTLNAKYERMS